MTILIATVGGAPDPIIHAIQQSRPTHLAFIASRVGVGTDKGSVDEIPKILSAAGWGGPTPITETTDRPDELTSAWEACRRLAEQLPADANVIANYTGGSKSMCAALVTYALRAGWSLQVQTARRTDLVKVAANDGARRVAVGHILAFDVRRQAAILEQRHDHNGAAILLEQFLATHDLEATLQDELEADIAANRFRDALDAYDFQTATRLLTARSGTLGRTHGATWNPRLKTFNTTLAWLSSSNDADPQTAPVKPRSLEEALSLVDFLVETATGSADRGRYDDGFSRLYRATEFLAQVVLRFAYDLRTADLDRARLPEAAVSRVGVAPDGKLQSSLMQSYELLAVLEHPTGRYFTGKRSQLRGLLDNRNASWLAHGFRSITHDLWRHHGLAWIQWIGAAKAAALS